MQTRKPPIVPASAANLLGHDAQNRALWCAGRPFRPAGICRCGWSRRHSADYAGVVAPASCRLCGGGRPTRSAPRSPRSNDPIGARRTVSRKRSFRADRHERRRQTRHAGRYGPIVTATTRCASVHGKRSQAIVGALAQVPGQGGVGSRAARARDTTRSAPRSATPTARPAAWCKVLGQLATAHRRS